MNLKSEFIIGLLKLYIFELADFVTYSNMYNQLW